MHFLSRRILRSLRKADAVAGFSLLKSGSFISFIFQLSDACFEPANIQLKIYL